jgi:AcrR family transcriptional regulator
MASDAQQHGRDARRAALLDAAALEFNAHGVSRASMSRVARSVGLTRAAVYYYVRDRDDLVAEVYRRSCETMAADLDAASGAGDAIARLTAFIRISLDPGRTPSAVLSELHLLKEADRATIKAAHDANVARLREIIRSGVEAGPVRACDDEVAAQSIIGAIVWAPLSVGWVDGTDDSFRRRSGEAMADLFVNGVAADPGFAFSPPIGIEAFFPRATNAFDRKALAEAKLEQLLMIASQVFNRLGVDGASVDDISRALGATKGAVYHYLDNRTDLVVRCFRRAMDLFERFADASEAHGRSGLERGTIGLYLNVQAQASGLSPLVQLAGAEALPAAARREITARSRALQSRFEAFGREGLADGSYRDVDFRVVSQLGAGAFEWLPKWFDIVEPEASEAVAGEIARLYSLGLRRR